MTQQGQYQVGLRVNTTYTIALLPDTLPSGVTPPEPQTVQVTDQEILDGQGAPLAEDNGYVLNIDIPVNGAMLHGTVSDLQGNPLGGVEVVVTTSSQPLKAVTDPSGFYSILLDPNLTYQEVSIGAGLPEEFAKPSSRTIELSGNPPVILVDGQQLADGTLNWQLTRAYAHLSGQAVMGGAPLEGWILVLQGQSTVAQSRIYQGTYEVSIPAGDFRVIVKPDSASGELVWPEAYELTVTEGNELLQLTHDFEFSSEAEGQKLIGQVTISGNPAGVVGLEIYRWYENAEGSGSWKILGYLNTRDDGTYSIKLAPGTYDLRVSQANIPQGQTVLTTTTFEVTSTQILQGESPLQGDSANGFIMDISIGQPSVTLHGVVRDPDGNPLSNVEVSVFLEGQADPVTAVTDSNGSYSINLDPNLTYSEVALSSGVPSDCVPPIAVDLEIQPGPTLLLDGQESADGTLNLSLIHI